jgi:hypothetical protein
MTGEKRRDQKRPRVEQIGVQGGHFPAEEISMSTEPIDIQAYAKEGKLVPSTGPYRIRINKDFFDWPKPTISGAEILDTAKKDPIKNAAYQFVRGKPQRVQVGEQVDLTAPGVERFETLPLDQTEG